MGNIDSSPDVRFAPADDAELSALAPAHWIEKAATMHFEKDRRLELVAGGLLIRMLAEHGVRNPKFKVSRFGKPVLDGNPDVHFSISHSDAMVMVAVANQPVGCDVERVQLTEGRDFAFYERWTRRESGLKMQGCGFADGASSEAPPDPRARNIPAPPGYCAAICTNHPYCDII